MNKTSYDRTFFDSIAPLSLASAEVIVPIVMSLLNPSSVVDVGCGTGIWLSEFKKHGVKQVLGFDGGYVNTDMLAIDKSEFSAADLTQPLQASSRFDLAISLEVAEHLPERCAPLFVRSLVGLSPLILFSAAFPGQGGTDHINERWPHYWERLFADNNYIATDPIRPVIWQQEQVAWWYRCNTLLFVKKDVLEKDERLKKYADGYSRNPLTLIRKDFLKRCSAPGFILKNMVRSLKRSVKQ